MAKEKPPKAVVWIASYPKSGNTFLQNVIRRAGKSHGFPGSDLDAYRMISEKRAPTAVKGGIQPHVSREPTTVLKTHRAHRPDDRIHEQLQLRTVGFVHIRRNPLDMLLSYINFTRLQYAHRHESVEYRTRLFIDLLGYDEPFSVEQWQAMSLDSIPRRHLDHALERFTVLDTDIPGLAATTHCSWLEHWRTWQAAGEHMPAVFLRYEDLLTGIEGFGPLGQIFQFVDKIPEALEEVNAASARKGRESSSEAIFFNKMSAYYYGDYFSADKIRAFLDKYAKELKAMGYGDMPAG